MESRGSTGEERPAARGTEMMIARCPWYVAGPLLGLLIVALRVAVNKPLGALGGYIDLVDQRARPDRLGFSAFMLFGIVLGGALFAGVAGTYSPTWLYSTAGSLLPADIAAQFAVLALSGVAMGIGARTAGGCTSGHGLCGVSLGSPASLISTITFFTTAVALAHAFAWLLGGTS
jgi:uncharacterized membrane protein YedE/YeeE